MSPKPPKNSDTRKRQANASDEAKAIRNEDPLSGQAGAHPVGTGVGAAVGGAATGAIAGSVAGPLGTVVGTVVGGVAGGLAGKAVAESIDPTIEAAYWRQEYAKRPYYRKEYSYKDYEPAYRAGWESYDLEARTGWAEREELARQRWESEGGPPGMSWDEAKLAAEDAYDRVHSQTGRNRR